MGAREWQEIMTLIESDKIKERSEGVQLVRGYLGSRSNFNALNAERRHSWTETLQALFGLVIKERNAVAHKSTTAGEKRLEDASALVGWVADKVQGLLPRKGVKSLIAHLAQMLASAQGQQQVFMLAYAKAFRSLLGNAAHVEHLAREQWGEIVMICFSIVLGDKVRNGQELADEEAMQNDDEDSERGSRNWRKRRAGTLKIVDSDEENETPPSVIRRSASALEIELVGCVEAVFRSRSAPFLPNGKVIFVKFIRLFRQYPTETTAHYPALVALNRAFAELDLNDQLMMRKLGVKLWSPILALWSTKNAGLKEQVVIALRQLLPFVLGPGVGSTVAGTQRIPSLYEAVLTEPMIRWRDSFELDIDHLRFQSDHVGDSPHPKPFEYRTVRLGHGFSDKEAIAWAVLELGADGLAKIHDVDAAASEQPLATPSRTGKRRRVEEPLSVLVDALEEMTEASTLLVFRVQLVLFFVERHSQLLHSTVYRRIVVALTSLISHTDRNVQTWSFVALAALAAIDMPLEGGLKQRTASPSKRRHAPIPPPWEAAWTLAMRKLSSPELSRVAAHVANVLLAYDRVPPGVVSATIENLAKEVDVLGPTFPSDAVCSFLEWCLALSTSDVRLYRLRLPEKILTWLLNAWKPLDGVYGSYGFAQSKPRSDPLSQQHLVSLVARLCGIDQVPTFSDQIVIPDCSVASLIIDHCETAAIRDYIDAKVPPLASEVEASRARSPSDLFGISGGGSSIDGEFRTERRVSTWLQRALGDLVSEGERGSDTYWDLMTLELAHRHLEFASIALNVEALLSLSKEVKVNKATVKVATDVLVRLAPSLGNAKWKPHERSLLLDALDSILVPLENPPAVQYPVLLDPGPASDIASHLIPAKRTRRDAVDFDSLELRLLHHLWSDSAVQAALGEIASVLICVVSGIASTTAAELTSSSQGSQNLTQAYPATQASQRMQGIARTQREDDFGEIKIATKAAQVLGPSSATRAGIACMKGCVRGIVSAEMASSGSVGSVRVNDLVEAIVNAPGTEAIVIAEQALNAVRAGVIDLGLSHAERVLQHLGGELLPDYQFARDERFALLGLGFLECTAPMWVLTDDSEAAEEFGSRARMLCSWYTSNLHRQALASWRVRLRFLVFLDLYLSLDRTQLRWDRGRHATRSADGSAILPTAIIPSMLADEDFRVRFRAATSAPALFTFMHENGIPDDPLFADIRGTLELNMAETERILTQILSQANIMIITASRRRAPYPLFLRQAADVPELVPRIVATLAGAAKRMGLDGLRGLYHLYDRYNVHMLAKQNALGAVGSLAYQIAGYSSLREVRKADYRRIASLLLVLPDGEEPFKTVCDVLQRKRSEVVLDCFPETVALLALRHAVDASEVSNSDSLAAMNDVHERIRLLAQDIGYDDDHQVGKLVASVSDEVVAQILSEMWEPDWTPELVNDVLDPIDKNASAAFKELLGLPEAELMLVEAAPPHYRLADVVTATRWFEQQYQCFSSSGSMYLIVQNLLARLHRAPFIALQKNLLIGLSLALALGRRAARDPSILDAVTSALVTLLPRVEITSAVASVVKWCIAQWIANATGVKASGAALCANVIRAACMCQAVIDSPLSTEDAITAATDLSSLLRQAVQKLRDNQQGSVNEAYLLWPTPIIDTNAMSLEAIARVLADSTSSICKLPIVRALVNRPDFAASSQRGTMLWRLMQTLSRESRPSSTDSVALAELLFQCAGEVEPPGLDKLAAADVVDAGLNEEPVTNDAGVRALILGRVLQSVKIEGHRPVELVEQSLRVARALFSVPSATELMSSTGLPSQHAQLVALLSNLKLLQPHRIRRAEPRQLTELSTEHWSRATEGYQGWVRSFAALLADAQAESEPFYAQLVPLISVDVSFAAQVLPLLVHSILIQSVQLGDGPSRQQLSTYLQRVLNDRASDLQCVALVVDTATYLRRHPRPDLGATSLALYDRWLDVPWVLLADGAVRTGQYLTALLFLELAHEYDQLFKRRDGRSSRIFDALDSRGQALLYDIYAEIDEPDGFYGRQSDDVREGLTRRYHHEDRWREAFALHGADFEANPSAISSTAGVLRSLASFGFNRLAMSLWQPNVSVSNTSHSSDVPTGLSYALAWRTETWDLPIERKSSSMSQAALYSTLRSVHSGQDVIAIEAMATKAIKHEVLKLASVSLDLPRPSPEAVATILAIREIKLLSSLRQNDRLSPERARELQSINPALSLKNADKMLSTRISLLRALRKKEEIDSVGDEFRSALWRDANETERACLLELSAVSRDHDHLQASMNAVTFASQLDSTESRPIDVDEELAMVLWRQGEHSTAISLLESVSRHKPPKQALIWARLGEWTANARLKSPREVIDGSYRPAVDLLDDSYSNDERARVHHSFAEFADHQYQEMSRAINERRHRFLLYEQRKTFEFAHIERQLNGGGSSGGPDSAQLRKVRESAQSMIEEDKQQLKDATAAVADMHRLALENYAYSLARSDERDDDVLRFCALWLAFSNDNELNRHVKPLLKQIPSHKFVFLTYQLSARLSGSQAPSPFAQNISSLVTRLCTDHPFHCLYAVNALRDIGSTLAPTNSGRSRRASTVSSSTEQSLNSSRAQAADEVFDKVRRVTSLKAQVDAIVIACDAYREWAEFSLRDHPAYWLATTGGGGRVKPGQLPVNKSSRIITNVVDLPIPVTTFDLPVDPTCRYDMSTYPSIHKYSPTFTTAGGVNLPKIVKCIGSDGKEYRQLLKGNDDIRQDAVMEQVFALVNNLLKRDVATRRRKLLIRTYKVVPLQNANGLLEFVVNTEPLKSKLDQFYERMKQKRETGMLTPREAVQELTAIRGKAYARIMSPPEMNDRLEAKFRELLPKVPPMLRHVFMQRHKVPSLWFEYRLNYSRSVATTSIVGHIVGLGDRHCSNILMDKIRGEMIAIDLGIAFDQGKKLPIPETVPFRLTQNIVDGFGMSGVEGVFRRCSEETLRVLRSRSNVLITVLEVFKHDPLQKWAVSAEMAKRIQNSEDVEAGAIENLPDDADRALSVVANKLDDRLSVAYTVNELIQEATDPANLSRIFGGWQCFL